MAQLISLVTIIVPAYEAGIAFYCDTLGFTLIEDTRMSPTKRWVVVSPEGPQGTKLLLAKADGAQQEAAIGQQTGGRVGFFLHTDDFEADYMRMKASGVTFLETPRDEPYAKVVVFQDPFGNKWDLLQPH